MSIHDTIFPNRRAFEQAAVAPFEQQAAAQAGDLNAALARATSKEERELRAQLSSLADRLAEAEATSEAAEKLLALAQAAYDRESVDGRTPASETILRLQQRQNEAQAARNAVATINKQGAELKQKLTNEAEREAQAAKRAHVAAVWPVAAARLLPIVLELLDELKQQQQIKTVLVDEGAWPFANGDLECVMGDGRSYDNLAPYLQRWVRTVQAAGITATERKPSKK